MQFIEITGQPCSGKSTFLRENKDKYFDGFAVFSPALVTKLISFICSLKLLGLSRVYVLFNWSMKEDVPFFFRCNIFVNAVSKFGIQKMSKIFRVASSSSCIVDEGISHLPFLFLNTDSNLVVNFISDELKNLNICLLRSPGTLVVLDRLKTRGHKRLRYTSANFFIEKNLNVENIILKTYPDLCSNLRIF